MFFELFKLFCKGGHVEPARHGDLEYSGEGRDVLEWAVCYLVVGGDEVQVVLEQNESHRLDDAHLVFAGDGHDIRLNALALAGEILDV